MRLATPILATLILCSGLLAQPALAGSNAVATMAGIVISLQHFPSDADKTALDAIASGDATDSEKTVARAIAAISHKVSDADKAKLEAIAADGDEPDDLRTLARVVAGINHMPSADDKAALSALMGS
jgi:hypothetical protein